jgi:nanoRNase/pAp phosphatase (c-di-AMP/oligoRNAs hydrolase)
LAKKVDSLINIKEIEESKYIVINARKDTLYQASILYSYILTQHKKVSIFSDETDDRLSFLPWLEKIKETKIISADLEISSDIEILELYEFFKKNSIKINKKMATSFYAGFLHRYNNFVGYDCDGIVFAALSELMAIGAEHKLCIEKMLQSVSLSMIRLKSLVFKNLLLEDNAQVACVRVTDDDLISSGASLEDVYEVAKELLNLVHVKEVRVLKSDEKDKILKIVKEVKIEK